MEAIRVFGPKLGSRLSIRSHTTAFPACKLSRFPLTSFPGKHAHLVLLKATTIPLASGDKENNRKFEKLGPSEWGNQFLFAHVDLSVSLCLLPLYRGYELMHVSFFKMNTFFIRKWMRLRERLRH